MRSLATPRPETRLAKTVAGEDLVRGDIVAVLNEIGEYVSCLWNGDTQVLPPQDPVRVQWRSSDKGRPLKVEEICLPFVFVKAPNGKYETLDVRQCQLVRLDAGYGRRVWKKLKKKRK